MNIEALERLADKLEGKGDYESVGPIPGDRFDLKDWSCGTVACAVGHAMFDPWFNERGLYARSMCARLTHDPISTKEPYYGSSFGFFAVKAFFGLTQSESSLLFSIIHYPLNPTPQMVAARIREFIKESPTEEE